MAELTKEHHKAISTIIECMLHTIHNLIEEDEDGKLEEAQIVRSFNHLFNVFAQLTSGKYGDQTQFIKEETKRLIKQLTNHDNKTSKTLEEVISEQLNPNWHL